jgi:exosortase A
MIWSQRHQIVSLAPSPNYWGLPIQVLLGIGWIFGYLASVMVVQQLALVAMLQMLVSTIAGWPVMRVLLFPLGFLFFAVPIGEDLVPPLQDYTALFTVKALQLTGIPVYRDGWMIVIPSGVWQVAEACAGVRYVIPSVILGCLFSYLVYHSWKRRLGFIMLCFFGAIVANGVRAYGIVMLAHLTDNRLAVGVDHLIAGWIFFSVIMFLLFWIGLRWRERDIIDVRGEVSAIQGKAAAIPVGSPRAMVLTALIAVALVSFPLFAVERLLRAQPALAPPTFSSLSVAQPWQALKEYNAGWKPRFLGADVKHLQSYLAGDRRVHLFIAYYHGNQRQGAELIGGGNVLIDTKEWLPVSAGSTQAVVDGDSVSVNRNVVRSKDRTRLVWSWYWAGGKYTSNPYFAKVLEIKNLLLSEQRGSAIIAVAVDVDNGDMREAADTLQNFLHHVTLAKALAPSVARDDR